MRIGQGFDVHPLVLGRRLVIGGVEIQYEKGLDGHSDADVLLHAICDALNPLGIKHVDMPATPDRIWKQIQLARGLSSNGSTGKEARK